MFPLNRLEKKLSIFILLPCYFVYGQYLMSALFLGITTLLDITIAETSIDAYFNLFYLGCLSIVAIFIFKDYLKESTHQMKGKWIKQLFYACSLGSIQFYFYNMASSLLILLLSPDSSSANQNAIVSLTSQEPLLMVITTVILAPFLEEMIFRVAVFQNIYEKNRFFAYLITSFSFGFVHISAGLFTGDFTQLLFLLPYGLLGFALCRFYEKRQSIFVPMVIHAINNLIAMLVIL